MVKSLASVLGLFTLSAASSLWAAAPQASKVDPALVLPFEWQEFRLERATLVNASPFLAAADAKLRRELDALKAKVDAATVQADPGTAPILKKLADLLRTSWGKSSKITISTAEWQQLRAARAAAFQAHPEILAATKRWQAEKHAYQAKVDAALRKADPSAAALMNWGKGER